MKYMKLWLILGIFFFAAVIVWRFTSCDRPTIVQVVPETRDSISLTGFVMAGVSEWITDSLAAVANGQVGETYSINGITMPICDFCYGTRSATFQNTPITMLVGHDLQRNGGSPLAVGASCIRTGGVLRPKYTLTTSMLWPTLLGVYATAPARTSGGARTGRQVSSVHFQDALREAANAPVQSLLVSRRTDVEANYLHALYPFFRSFCEAYERNNNIDVEIVLDGRVYQGDKLGSKVLLPHLDPVSVNKTYVE